MPSTSLPPLFLTHEDLRQRGRAKSQGTPLTPEHLVGSAEVRIRLSADKKNYEITIWNTTSVGSGTLGMGRYPRGNEGDKYTNVSQTYELLVPVKN